MKKTKLMWLTYAAALVIPAAFLTGCEDDDGNDVVPPPAEQTITDIVVAGADFTLLEAAVVKAGLADELAAGTLTVFAPNNAAFQASGITQATIDALTAEQLAAILTYHVVDGENTAADLPTGDNTAIVTLNTDSVYVTKNSAGVSVNGATVTQADVDASNGVIHVINKVLIPALGNIVETAQANENLSYLVAAVLRASEGTTNVAQILSGAGPLTVFAPTNAAFQAAGFATIADVEAADPATLTNILTYHVVPARVFSTNLANGPVTTAQGSDVTVAVGTGVTVTGAGNGGAASNVVAADVITTNGVVHVIDRVLLPE